MSELDYWKWPNPVLEQGSRCKNCLKAYTYSEFKHGYCKYHPGFIAEDHKKTATYTYDSKSENIEVVNSGETSVIVSEKKWNCCGELASDTSTEYQEVSHAHTGCARGPHNFRPVKLTGNKHSGGKCFPVCNGPNANRGGRASGSRRRERLPADTELMEEYAPPPRELSFSLADLIHVKGKKT